MLRTLALQFKKALEEDPSLREEHAERHERQNERFATLLQPARLRSLTPEELRDLLEDTDAWRGVRFRSRFWRELLGPENERLAEVRAVLESLVRRAEAGLTAEDFSEFCKALHGIGPAFLSEILAHRFPNRYWMWNKQNRDFFQRLGMDVRESLPKKSDQGAEYMAAQAPTDKVRSVLTEVLGKPVDYGLCDLFMYWANRQPQAPLLSEDPWGKRIAELRKRYSSAEEIEARRKGEALARKILERKAGRFTEDDLSQFMNALNRDAAGRNTRFMPAFYGVQVHRMANTLEAFNYWVERLWKAEDHRLDEELDAFWDAHEVGGAGISLPTAILYLRDPQRYNVWLRIMEAGLRKVTDFQPGPYEKASSYRAYNEAVLAFRERYGLEPQEVDLILWALTQETKEGDEKPLFPGFPPDTFQFLRELKENNTREWFHANKERYEQALREPLQALFQAVAPTMRELDPLLETRNRLLSRINKRQPDEEGPYYSHYWGAFYRRGHTRQSDAQLFVSVFPEQVFVGLSIAGRRATEVRKQFRENLEKAPDLFLQILRALPQEVQVALYPRRGHQDYSDRKVLRLDTPNDISSLLQLYDSDHYIINIEKEFPADAPILQTPDFADKVAEFFQALYPAFVFATSEDLDKVEDLLGSEEEEPEERYTRDALREATFLDDSFWDAVEALLEDKKQIIFYGPPGTGKTWLACQFARYWVESGPDPSGQIAIVQFHPSYSYEEFMEGIRPQSEEINGLHQITYPVRKGVFRRFCERARGRPGQRHVLILDEINRGDLPRILGELLYLLEYRDQVVTLPYSGEVFTIPETIYIIGTMNTADRSIALVDHALRRRFHFVPLRPNPQVLKAFLEKHASEMVWVAKLLETLNKRLEDEGVEWHLHIGHSHFMRKNLDEDKLRLVWQHSILPTLEEYFYRHPEKLEEFGLDRLRGDLEG